MLLDAWYYVKNSQNWIANRLNTNFVKIIDPKVDKNVATITTKQWRTPNAGFIKVYPNELDKDYLGYLWQNDVAFIKNESDGEVFLLRIITEEEAFLFMGFSKKDYKKIEEMYRLIGGN